MAAVDPMQIKVNVRIPASRRRNCRSMPITAPNKKLNDRRNITVYGVMSVLLTISIKSFHISFSSFFLIREFKESGNNHLNL